jgi:hypothetical protein
MPTMSSKAELNAAFTVSIRMRSIWQDLRYGCREFVRQPSFTCIAILARAMGIGCATMIFSFIQNVVFDPMLALRYE